MLFRSDRLEELEQLPKPKKPKLVDPGKIVSDWEGAPLPKSSRELEQLGDLM